MLTATHGVGWKGGGGGGGVSDVLDLSYILLHVQETPLGNVTASGTKHLMSTAAMLLWHRHNKRDIHWTGLIKLQQDTTWKTTPPPQKQVNPHNFSVVYRM